MTKDNRKQDKLKTKLKIDKKNKILKNETITQFHLVT